MICKQCGNERHILNKKGICVFCSNPRKRGTETKTPVVDKKGGSIVEVKASKFVTQFK